MKFAVTNQLFPVIVFILLSVSESRNTERGRIYEDEDFHSSDARNDHNPETDKFFWNRGAQLTLQERLSHQINTNVAKNTILFIGDGMSIATVAAARTYMGQLQGKSGEGSRLSFEEFPNIGLSKTYCVDKQVADSACTATAYLCGVKANYGTIGVSGRVERYDCLAANEPQNQLTSIARWAQLSGKSTGIVTTTRVTHASPAGTYANVANRLHESDADVINLHEDPSECNDIASQLINGPTGRNFNVILGGGRTKFLPKDVFDEDGQRGARFDGKNLIDKWRKQKQNVGGVYVHDRNGLKACDFNKTNYLLGLFHTSHLDFNLEADHNKQPSLAEMTEAAIKVLSKNPNGFFLFVEGGRIDHGHHATQTRKALDETVQLSEAVRMATKLTNTNDTLIVTTSDHSHTMTITGYSKRGSDILGLSNSHGTDKLKYMTLSYANGPKNYMTSTGTRMDLSKLNIKDKNFLYPAAVVKGSESHGGDDVGIFALGPWSHLFSAVIEENVIPHIMAFASCIGDKLTVCSQQKPK